MLFVSTSGPLGRYIELSPVLTIATRAVLAFFILWGYCKYRGFSLKIARAHRVPVILSGVFMGAHWVTYFYSLQLSNVAIGMLSLFTYPIITAFLEPLLLKTKLERIHLFLGILVLCGIYFLVPDFDFENGSTLAVLVGLFSAVLYSLRNIILKRQVGAYNGSSLMTWQMAVVGVGLMPFFFSDQIAQIRNDLPWILMLAVLTTAVGHTLFLKCFRHFSITSISILSSVQPIYGIILGAILLHEIPSWGTVAGGALILSAVIIESYRTRISS